MDELKDLTRVLINLQTTIQADPQSVSLQELGDLLQRCLLKVKKVVDKLESKKKWSGMSLGARLKWPFAEKETLEFLSRVERFKSLFTLVLNLDQL